jgi:molecular chaperone DnaK (HSP70)
MFDLDVSFDVSRALFQTLCEEKLTESMVIVKRTLIEAGLTPDDIDEVLNI